MQTQTPKTPKRTLTITPEQVKKFEKIAKEAPPKKQKNKPERKRKN